MRKSVTILIVMTIVTAAVSCAVDGEPAETMESYVTGCSAARDWTFRYSAYSLCNTASGTAHRVYMVCKTAPNHSVDTYVGPWVGPGQRSQVWCPHPTEEVLSFGSDFPD
jgi:hypothetical protein